MASIDGLVNRNSQNIKLIFKAEKMSPLHDNTACSIIDIANGTWDYSDVR